MEINLIVRITISVWIILIFAIPPIRKVHIKNNADTPLNLISFLIYLLLCFIISTSLSFISFNHSNTNYFSQIIITTIIFFVSHFIIWLIYKYLSILPKINFTIIYPALYFGVGLGLLIIFLKYLLINPYSQKVICSSCFCYNKARDSRKNEIKNYYASFCYESLDKMLLFNKKNPFYKENNGQLRFGHNQRFCKFCNSILSTKSTYYKLTCYFGKKTKVSADTNTYILMNPNVKNRDFAIDLSSIIIDSDTTDKKKLESFISFICNYPPKIRINKLPIYYYGDFKILGTHMHNLLHNTFHNFIRMDNENNT